MPIVVGTTASGSTSGTYSGLIDDIVDTLKDESLEDSAPRFIFLAEAWFNRELYPLDDETSATLSATVANAGLVALPTDYKHIRAITYDGDYELVLPQLSLDEFKQRFLSASAGPPEAFALAGNKIWIGPTPDATYSLTCHYIQGIPNLSQSNQTNWLIEAHPDLYFHGAMMYAELHGWNDERAMSVFSSSAQEILEQVKRWDFRRRNGNVHDTIAGTYF